MPGLKFIFHLHLGLNSPKSRGRWGTVTRPRSPDYLQSILYMLLLLLRNLSSLPTGLSLPTLQLVVPLTSSGTSLDTTCFIQKVFLSSQALANCPLEFSRHLAFACHSTSLAMFKLPVVCLDSCDCGFKMDIEGEWINEWVMLPTLLKANWAWVPPITLVSKKAQFCLQHKFPLIPNEYSFTGLTLVSSSPWNMTYFGYWNRINKTHGF